MSYRTSRSFESKPTIRELRKRHLQHLSLRLRDEIIKDMEDEIKELEAKLESADLRAMYSDD